DRMRPAGRSVSGGHPERRARPRTERRERHGGAPGRRPGGPAAARRPPPPAGAVPVPSAAGMPPVGPLRPPGARRGRGAVRSPRPACCARPRGSTRTLGTADQHRGSHRATARNVATKGTLSRSAPYCPQPTRIPPSCPEKGRTAPFPTARGEGDEPMRRATGALVDADGLELRTGEGPVFSRIGFTAEPGSLTVFEADAGGGRTALLLALGGRMRPTSGALRVDGYELPRQARRARRIAALALASGVNDLDERLRVSEHMAERLLLRFRPAPASVSEPALAEAGLAGLDPRTLVKDLSALERRRLGVALALLEEPRLLLVDDADAGLGERNRRAFWSLLRDLAGTGLT